MKWIGQHIYDFISRFRSDVYLENLSTTTETSALVVDSDGKVSKNVTSGVNMTNGADNRVVTAVGTNGLQAEAYLSFQNIGNVSSLAMLSNQDTGDYFLIQTIEHGATTISTVDDDATAAHLTLSPDGNIVLDPASQQVTCDAFSFTLSSSAAGPVLSCLNNVDDSAGGILALNNSRDGNGLEDGDALGQVQFSGDDASGNSHTYARIDADVIESDHGSETARLEFKVAEYDGTLTNGLILSGQDQDGEIDVTIGAGAASTTTIAGDLDIDGDTITSAGALTIQPADISGQALIIDADADTDNEVEINAGLLDINTTAAITIDATTSISINSGHNLDIESGRSQINKTYDFHATTFENLYAADTGSGTIIKYSPASSSSLNGSEIYYLRINGSWAQADAGAASSSGPCILGVGLGGDPQTVGVLLKGFVMVASTEILNTPGSGNVDGLPVYVSTTAGHFDFTAPSGSGDVVRIVGYAIDDHLGAVLIYFDPDKTWVEIA